MNKRLFMAIAITGYCAKAIAQPALTAANSNPVPGDAFTNYICDTTGVTPGAAGAGVTWNFTGLISTSTDTGAATACAATANCSLFAGSTYAIVSHATEITPYYIASATKLQQNGYFISADTNAVYSTPIDQFQYPVTYNTTFSAPYAGTITLGAISAHETGTITVTCDGYGTLKLPGFVNDSVLRVHSSQLFADSLNLFGTGINEIFKLETYSWYMPGYHAPLLSILTTTMVGGSYSNKVVSYTPVQIATAVPSIAATDAALKLYPNPVSSELNIEYTSAISEHVRITLCDIAGRTVAMISDKQVQGTQSIAYNSSKLAKGLYLLRLESGATTIIRMVSVQ